MKALLLIFLLCFSSTSLARDGRLFESWYTKRLATQLNAVTPAKPLADGTWPDLVSKDGAFVCEVDFASNHKEGLGQTLHYARVTGKHPVLILILEKPRDRDYVQAALANIEANQLPVRVITCQLPERLKIAEH